MATETIPQAVERLTRTANDTHLHRLDRVDALLTIALNFGHVVPDPMTYVSQARQLVRAPDQKKSRIRP